MSLYVATHDFFSDSEKKLSFKAGDVLYLRTKLDNGWWYGQHQATKRLGYFPPKYVNSLDKTEQGNNGTDPSEEAACPEAGAEELVLCL